MITGDRDRVELRHLLRGVLEDISDNLHGELRRIDIGITYHELFQYIVLDRTGHFLQLSTLLQTCVDIECQYRKHTTIHGHGNRHLVQRNTIEQHFHVLQGTDRYTRFTYITNHTFVVGIVTTVSRKVERNGQTFLTGSQVTAIESVRLLSGRETCVLTDCPRTHSVHTAVRAT